MMSKLLGILYALILISCSSSLKKNLPCSAPSFSSLPKESIVWLDDVWKKKDKASNPEKIMGFHVQFIDPGIELLVIIGWDSSSAEAKVFTVSGAPCDRNQVTCWTEEYTTKALSPYVLLESYAELIDYNPESAEVETNHGGIVVYSLIPVTKDRGVNIRWSRLSFDLRKQPRLRSSLIHVFQGLPSKRYSEKGKPWEHDLRTLQCNLWGWQGKECFE